MSPRRIASLVGVRGVARLVLSGPPRPSATAVPSPGVAASQP
jgi:hypothetical protein